LAVLGKRRPTTNKWDLGTTPARGEGRGSSEVQPRGVGLNRSGITPDDTTVSRYVLLLVATCSKWRNESIPTRSTCGDPDT
jgi:hypothetical protein